MRLGSLTQRFFLRAQEEEATQYKDLVDPSLLEAPKLEFDSFDKIPRKRRPLLAVVGLVSLVAVGGVAWKMTRGLPTVTASARAAVASEPPVAPPQGAVPQSVGATPPAAAAAALMTAQAAPAAPADSPDELTVVPAAPEAATATARQQPMVEPIAAQPRAPAPDRVPVVVPISATPRTRVAADSRAAASTSAVKHRSAPLRGYVWSPKANAIVPAAGDSPGYEPGIAAPNPSAAPVERPVTDPEDTSPEPFHTTPAAPSEAAPILN